MYDSKLISIIKVLGSEEKELLGKWLHSPAHNHREDRRKLFEYLLSKRKLTPFTCNREKVYQHVFPGEEYNDPKLKRLMNLSILLLEEFIHFLMQKDNDFSRYKSVISFLGKHQLDKYTEQYIQKTRKMQIEAAAESSEYFSQQYQLEQEIFKNQSTVSRKNTNLQEVIDTLQCSYILDSLHLACQAVTHKRLYKSEYDQPLLEHILKEIEEGKFSENPSIQMYFYSYKALVFSEEEQYFEILKSLLFENYDRVSHRELRTVYLMAVNYCIQKLNTGKEKYVRSVFEMFQYGLQHSILIENNILSRFTYKNIVASGLRLKEFDWIVYFIETYTPYLEDIYKEAYSLYAKAKLHFAQGDFDTTLPLLSQVEFDNIFLSMDAKVMLLKIYYEKGYYDSLEALLNSFRRFLQRKSILAYQRNIHGNMIQLTEKLLITASHEKEKIAALRLEIESKEPLTEKPWLLEQLDKK
jgi:hypothetical protein